MLFGFGPIFLALATKFGPPFVFPFNQQKAKLFGFGPIFVALATKFGPPFVFPFNQQKAKHFLLGDLQHPRFVWQTKSLGFFGPIHPMGGEKFRAKRFTFISGHPGQVREGMHRHGN